MSAASRMRTWWRAIWRGDELDREMQAELEHHIASYAADLERGGMARDEAERRARAELGSVTARKEDCRSGRRRSGYGWRWERFRGRCWGWC